MNLPYDIWVHIAQYLSPVQLRDLYSVNQAFYDLAMNERYREVNLHYLTDPDTIRNISRLRDIQVARRVRKLSFHPSLINKLVDDGKQRAGTQTWPRRIKISLKGFKTVSSKSAEKRMPFPSETAVANITDMIQKMTGVTSYSIEFWNRQPLDSLHFALPVLRSAWSTFGDVLTELNIDVPLQGLSNFLDESLTFTSLRAFSIRLTKMPQSTLSSSTEIISHKIIPFMNNHVYTLEKLSMTTIEGFDFSAFLPSLQHFPYLAKVHISHPFVSLQQTNTSGLRYFLAIHSGCMKDLNLQFHLPPNTIPKIPSSASWYSQDFFRVYLNSLESLELSLRGNPGDATSVLSYLDTLKSTLTSLTLRDHPFSLQEVRPLVRLFQHTGILRSLTIEVAYITPQLLDVFAVGLPSIQRLTLTCEAFTDEGPSQNRPFDSPVLQHQLFCSSLRKRDYSLWRLQHFTGYTTGQSSGSINDCKAAIFEAFPSLQTIDGKPVTEFSCGTPVSSTSSMRAKSKSLLLSKRASFASLSTRHSRE
ncbi:hypothetical protein AX16_002310 [Volvariella volvacea WC 439]|nr:hypothetical protein AX16_002310 [Volvariella volvacea WC 439]